MQLPALQQSVTKETLPTESWQNIVTCVQWHFASSLAFRFRVTNSGLQSIQALKSQPDISAITNSLKFHVPSDCKHTESGQLKTER